MPYNGYALQFAERKLCIYGLIWQGFATDYVDLEVQKFCITLDRQSAARRCDWIVAQHALYRYNITMLYMSFQLYSISQCINKTFDITTIEDGYET